ncbi:MAG: hypothetical protein AUK03_13360 [Anaerolineae bacterium CG2_30_64_16]|nr:MAG: hypothetical protein AUK03_13360 [Anaerolineae bacterium CG2_30_64_16]
MDSAMIAKISKAREYSEEPERITFRRFEVGFEGKHQVYTITFDHGAWQCECDFFGQRGVCVHTMTLERVLGVMLEEATPVAA